MTIRSVSADDVCLIPLTQGLYALIDRCDLEEISKYKWHVMRTLNTSYAVRSIRVDGRVKKVLMHYQILPKKDGFEIDHINGFGLDSRRENLRYGTHSQNLQNQQKRSCKNRASQYKGVSLQTGHKKYTARITVNNKLLFLGVFDTEIEAARAYDEAAKKHFREFARTNFDYPEGYGSQERL